MMDTMMKVMIMMTRMMGDGTDEMLIGMVMMMMHMAIVMVMTMVLVWVLMVIILVNQRPKCQNNHVKLLICLTHVDSDTFSTRICTGSGD